MATVTSRGPTVPAPQAEVVPVANSARYGARLIRRWSATRRARTGGRLRRGAASAPAPGTQAPNTALTPEDGDVRAAARTATGGRGG